MQYLLWILLLLSILFWCGFTILLVNLKNIIIWSRRPYLLIIEQLSIFIIMILISIEVPCAVVLAFSIVALMFTFIRSTYIYEYLAENTGIVSNFNKLLWRKNHKLNIIQALVFVTCPCIVAVVLALVHGYSTNTVNNSCAEYPMLAGSVVTSLLWIMDFIYVVLIWFKRLKDKIGMRLEIFGRVVTTVMLFILFAVLKEIYGINNYKLNTFIIIANLIFWGTYMPLIFMVSHHYKTRNINLLGNEYSLQQMDTVSRQFFCRENVLFLKKYEEYKLCMDLNYLDSIIDDFIKIGSPHQLNIAQDLRDKVLKDENAIELVYDQVIMMIKDNILPYVKDFQ